MHLLKWITKDMNNLLYQIRLVIDPFNIVRVGTVIVVRYLLNKP